MSAREYFLTTFYPRLFQQWPRQRGVLRPRHRRGVRVRHRSPDPLHPHSGFLLRQRHQRGARQWHRAPGRPRGRRRDRRAQGRALHSCHGTFPASTHSVREPAAGESRMHHSSVWIFLHRLPSYSMSACSASVAGVLTLNIPFFFIAEPQCKPVERPLSGQAESVLRGEPQCVWLGAHHHTPRALKCHPTNNTSHEDDEKKVKELWASAGGVEPFCFTHLD